MNEKNFYEVLGVGTHVGAGQIQAAYRFARTLYTGDSAATYGMLDADEKARMLALVEEAYATLASPAARHDYDARLAAGKAPVEAQPGAAKEEATRRVEPTNPAEPIAMEPVATTVPMRTPVPVREPPLDLLAVPDMLNGAALRALRESRNLSIDQIAALSKVGTRFLKALEEDHHAVLPGRVFARGFLIEYARAIRAPESEIVERYLRHWKAG